MHLRRREQVDSITGDTITRSEKISITVQSVMRQWKFVIGYSILTFIWWTHPVWFGDHPGNDARWQDFASYMALLIESLVGIGMFGWARRDSVILRRIDRLEREADASRDVYEPLMRAIAAKLEVEVPDGR